MNDFFCNLFVGPVDGEILFLNEHVQPGLISHFHHLRVHGDAPEKRQIQLIGQCFTATTAENSNVLLTMGANKPAHIFDNAKNF